MKRSVSVAEARATISPVSACGPIQLVRANATAGALSAVRVCPRSGARCVVSCPRSGGGRRRSPRRKRDAPDARAAALGLFTERRSHSVLYGEVCVVLDEPEGEGEPAALPDAGRTLPTSRSRLLGPHFRRKPRSASHIHHGSNLYAL